MRHETLLLSIRRLRMIEVDNLGTFAQLELLITRKPSEGNAEPRAEVATFALFAPDRRNANKREPNANKRQSHKKRWEAS